jgi:cytidine deaminase
MKKTLRIEYNEYSSSSELNETDQHLLRSAQNALKDAYAPYSKFQVGAAILLESGEIVTGNNQENIAFPSGMCAERVALFHVGANYPNQKILTLAIAAEGDLVDKDAIISPCGACRQVIFESEMRQQSSVRILIIGMNNKVIELEKSTDLLTFAFGL